MRLLCHKPTVPNFGDDLNGVLWPALAPALFEPDEEDEAFVGIGTIVGIDPGRSMKLNVFSSGAGYTSVRGWQGREVEYHCVRGPVTARVLGLDPGKVLTDGAILAPSVAGLMHSQGHRAGGVVVIPHFETIAFPGWSEAVKMAGLELVDPRGTPQEVIGLIAGARRVVTESLHGAILSDAFDVPWRPFAVSRNFSTAKWADWAVSLDLQVDVALVPPPDAAQLLRFGRRDEPFGSSLRLDADGALAEFRDRIKPAPPPSFFKGQVKRLLDVLPVARRVLGFHPARTAEALAQVADMPPYLSNPTRRAALRDEMLGRLDALARRQGAELAAVGD